MRCQQLFGGEPGIRTPYTLRWKIYSLLKSPMLLALRTWWRWQGSNLRHFGCKPNALPTELHPQILGDPERIWTSDIWFWRPTFCRTELRSHLTLLRMCVSKHSSWINPHKRECFDTLGFFYVQEHKPSPRPPICSFECCRLALPCTLISFIERYRESIANTLLLTFRFSLKTKTLEFLVPGSLN